MSKRQERDPRFRAERERYREDADRELEAAAWDRCPMKQYVRRYAWLEIVQTYVQRRRASGVDRPLKYLTIPGANASDIGVLWRAGLLLRDDTGFPYVAICDKESAGVVQGNLGVLLGVSDRWFYQAVHGELRELFPFDVINMDLCGAVVTGDPRRYMALRRLASIRRIFQLQRGQSFLLLLTTSTNDRSAQQYLVDVLTQNFDEETFREPYLGRFGVVDMTPFQRDYRAFVRLVLPKLMGWMARDGGYRIVERFVGRYDRNGHRLICLSLEFEALGRRKAAKKYEPRFKFSNGLTEQLSSRVRGEAIVAYDEFLPNVVEHDPVDIPQVLAANTQLEADLRQEAESLIGWWEVDDEETP